MADMTIEQVRDQLRKNVSPMNGYYSPQFNVWADAIDQHIAASQRAEVVVSEDAERYRILRAHADARDSYQPGPGGTMLVGYAEDEDICGSGEELDRMCDRARATSTAALAARGEPSNG